MMYFVPVRPMESRSIESAVEASEGSTSLNVGPAVELQE